MVFDKTSTYEEYQAEMVRLFLEGQSAKHIVYLLDYKYDTGHVNQAIRQELKRLRGALDHILHYAKGK